MTQPIDQRRIRVLREAEVVAQGPVLYWMNRDMRADDNWAMLHAAHLAEIHEKPLGVVYNLDPHFLGGGLRQLAFKIEGLQELEEKLSRLNIPLFLTLESGVEEVIRLAKKLSASALVTDFSPLRIQKMWTASVVAAVHIPVHQVDTHNIVPCWLASPKQEYAAATFRPKIHRLLPEFLTDFPALKKCEYRFPTAVPAIHWKKILDTAKTDRSIPPVALKAGAKAAEKALKTFLHERFDVYAEARNDPSILGQSDLSPYFHYGFLSPQRVAYTVSRMHSGSLSQEAYIEELVVRRELADNFCFYQSQYDSCAGFPNWAKKTLDEHRKDPRPYLYSPKQLEKAETHDPMWNAAQTEMVTTGKMHGYMRMYWAKKILEWTKTPEDAMKIAIDLNDKYELDGRDPNGYTGIAWAIGGVHDRPWANRSVFGMVRYMNDAGLKRKFDTKAYIQKTLATGTLL